MNYICSFCNYYYSSTRSIENSNYFWTYCSVCDVSYKMNQDLEIVITRFHIPLKNNYGIDLCHTLGETHIIKLPNAIDELITVIYILPSIIPDLNPDNCKSKLKTYLTFL